MSVSPQFVQSIPMVLTCGAIWLVGIILTVAAIAFWERRTGRDWQTVKDDGQHCYQVHKRTGRRRAVMTASKPLNADWLHGRTDQI